ncbi:hypothetical protein N9K45_00060, partial [bacterium]|nr:hypothetical protein [bacterium]
MRQQDAAAGSPQQGAGLFGSVAALSEGVSGMFSGVSGMFPALAPETLEAPFEGTFRHVTPQLALGLFARGDYDAFQRHCEEHIVSQAWDGQQSTGMTWNISSAMQSLCTGSVGAPLLDFSVPRTAADMPTAQMLFATCASIHSWMQGASHRIAVILAHEDDRSARLPMILACLALWGRVCDSVPKALEVAAVQLGSTVEKIRMTLPPAFLRYTYYFDEVMESGRLPSSGRLQLDAINGHDIEAIEPECSTPRPNDSMLVPIVQLFHRRRLVFSNASPAAVYNTAIKLRETGMLLCQPTDPVHNCNGCVLEGDIVLRVSYQPLDVAMGESADPGEVESHGYEFSFHTSFLKNWQDGTARNGRTVATCKLRIIKPELQFLSDDSSQYVSDGLVIYLFFSQLTDEADDSDDEEFLPGISPGRLAAVDSQAERGWLSAMDDLQCRSADSVQELPTLITRCSAVRMNDHVWDELVGKLSTLSARGNPNLDAIATVHSRRDRKLRRGKLIGRCLGEDAANEPLDDGNDESEPNYGDVDVDDTELDPEFLATLRKEGRGRILPEDPQLIMDTSEARQCGGDTLTSEALEAEFEQFLDSGLHTGDRESPGDAARTTVNDQAVNPAVQHVACPTIAGHRVEEQPTTTPKRAAETEPSGEAGCLSVDRHSSLGDLDRKLQELGARDGRLGKMLEQAGVATIPTLDESVRTGTAVADDAAGCEAHVPAPVCNSVSTVQAPDTLSSLDATTMVPVVSSTAQNPLPVPVPVPASAPAPTPTPTEAPEAKPATVAALPPRKG